MPRVVIRARRWAALLAITGLLLLPVTMWAHAREMAEMPCATGQMPDGGHHGAPSLPDRPSGDDCCTLCLVCTPLVALPVIALSVGEPVALPVVGVSRTAPDPHHPSPPAHLLPFALGPPLALA